jgi:hypothetical protein
LPLFVLGIALADDADDALSLDDFAVLANRLHAGTNLHTSLLGRVSRIAVQYRDPWEETQVKAWSGDGSF